MLVVGVGSRVFVGCSSSEVSEVAGVEFIDLSTLSSPEVRVETDVEVSVDEDDDGASRGGEGVKTLRNGDVGEACFRIGFVGEGGVDEASIWMKLAFVGDRGERIGGVGDAARKVEFRFVFILGCTGSLAVVNVEYCEPFESRRPVMTFAGASDETGFALLAAKKNFSPGSTEGALLSGRSFAWKKFPLVVGGGTGVVALSLIKLGALFIFRDPGLISDLVLLVESDRSLVRGGAGPKFGDFTFADAGATTNAGPKLGFSLASGSDPSVLTRLRRSEDRFVTVTGILLSILFVGVSYPHFTS